MLLYSEDFVVKKRYLIAKLCHSTSLFKIDHYNGPTKNKELSWRILKAINNTKILID